MNQEAHLLRERVKELNCLYNISRILEKGLGDVPGTLLAVAELMPAAWQFPEVAGTRIVFHDDAYQSEGFAQTRWMQSCPLLVQGVVAGSVTVSYREPRPQADEGPFLMEERSLLNTVAQRLGSFIERETVRRQLLEYQDKLRSLTSQLSLSEQRERRRIAESLHDQVGQNLALLGFRLAEAERAAEDSQMSGLLAEARQLLDEVIAQTRSLTVDLCPPILYELGLAPALEWLGDRLQQEYGLRVSTEIVGQVEPLPEETRVTLFQSVRELLNNVAKHAQAGNVWISVKGELESLTVCVRDDGIGFDDAVARSDRPAGDGFGLFSIRERLTYLGGTMEIGAPASGGSFVRLTVGRGGD